MSSRQAEIVRQVGKEAPGSGSSLETRERAMKVEEVILRVVNKQNTFWQTARGLAETWKSQNW